MADVQKTSDYQINISLSQQTLTLFAKGQPWLAYRISTALNGAGEHAGSGCTPRGQHRIRAMIGARLPSGSVFVGRRPTGEIYTPVLARQQPERDWILTRILWLCGEEPGVNRSGQVDSMRRFIYIHGTPDTEPMGRPLSHGCIRMRNADVIQLFALVSVGTKVLIQL